MKFRLPWLKDSQESERAQCNRLSFDKLPDTVPQDTIALLVTFKGEVTLKLNRSSDKEVLLLTSNTGIIFNHLSTLQIESSTPDFSGLMITLNTGNFVNHLSMIKYTAGKESGSQPLNMILIPKGQEMTYLLNSLDCYTSNPFLLSTELIESKIFEVLWLVNNLSKFNFDRFASNYLNADKIFFDWVLNKYFCQNPSIEQLAEYTGLSPSTFKRKFNRIYKCSPKKWIKKMRLEHAKTMLQYSNKTISEVGYEAGFENISHFIQVFRNTYGATPKSFFTNDIANNLRNDMQSLMA